MEKESIFHCEHPIRIRNKYDGKVYYVPCRKCAACKTKKAIEWTNRLNQESRCHPYSFFGTLTYAPKYLPYLMADYDREVLFSPFDPEVEYKFSDLPLDKLSHEYIKRRKCLPVANMEDARKFIKRVRERIRSNDSGEPRENRYLRYYLVSEFGETVLRPHFHFLFFTASKWFAENAASVVSSCWSVDNRRADSEKLGRCDCQSVKASASSYVASYLTCTDNLPKIYSFRKFRPIALCSRQPPIGTLFESSEEIREIFQSGSCTKFVPSGEGNGVLEIPFPSSFCNRLYPKLKGFDRIPVDVLNRLYDQAVEASVRSFEEFREYVTERSRENTDVGRYYREMILPCRKMDSLSPDKKEDPESAIHGLFSILNRFHVQRLAFGCSVNDYVRRIIDFWKDREYFMLKTQEKYQERIAREKSPCYTLLVDFDLVSCLRNRIDEFLKVDNLDGFIDLMKTYGIYFYEDSFSLEKFKLMSFMDDRATAKYFEKSNVVVSESKKRHEKNDYLMKADLEEDLRQFLIYFNSVKHGYKKCN